MYDDRCMTTSVLERLAAYHRGRDPERVRRQYDRMATSPWDFFQGTCHEAVLGPCTWDLADC